MSVDEVLNAMVTTFSALDGVTVQAYRSNGQNKAEAELAALFRFSPPAVLPCMVAQQVWKTKRPDPAVMDYRLPLGCWAVHKSEAIDQFLAGTVGPIVSQPFQRWGLPNQAALFPEDIEIQVLAYQGRFALGGISWFQWFRMAGTGEPFPIGGR